ncbi:MAG: hypothetical protein U1E20_14160 [Methylocystis sp.]|uniref:hypothetical protein n=1 Tax=Methylocystis sp. TaxID=1911079 RepID=UPI003951D607
MGITKLSILSGCAVLALAMGTSAAPVGLASQKSVGLSAPVEKASYCHRRHVRRAARCCEYYDAAVPVVIEPLVVEEPADFDDAAPVVAEEPVGFYGYAAPGAPIGFGYYGYSGPVQVVVPSGDYCATSVRTCLLKEPGVLGTGCSCHIPGGVARGLVE